LIAEISASGDIAFGGKKQITQIRSLRGITVIYLKIKWGSKL